MKDLLNLLLIEDVEDDALLVLRELRRGGFHPMWQRVETLEELQIALEQKLWDIVISDYRLPRFDAPNALKAVRLYHQSIPFILVSGTIGEVLAVEMMKAGANDYVMKENLKRLPEAVRRELRDAQVRFDRQQTEVELRESEERYRLLAENTNDLVCLHEPDGRYVYVSPSSEILLGYHYKELIGQYPYELFHPEDCDLIK